MAELTKLFTELLDGAVESAAKAESRHLKDDAQLAKDLVGKDMTGGVPVDVLTTLLDKGYVPDFFMGAELEVDAQLTMTTARERTVDGKGAVSFGPVQLEASFSNTLHQGTQTNLSIRCLLRRVSKSQAMDRVVESIQRLSELAPSSLPLLPPNDGQDPDLT